MSGERLLTLTWKAGSGGSSACRSSCSWRMLHMQARTGAAAAATRLAAAFGSPSVTLLRVLSSGTRRNTGSDRTEPALVRGANRDSEWQMTAVQLRSDNYTQQLRVQAREIER